ncbi:MAG: 30S ribosomal protein S16 [Actinomycetes bacterium]
MAVKIKLMRLGKIRTPHYRIVVADARTARNSKAIEEIGRYTPTSEPSFIQVDSARVQYWLGVGALPTEAVEVLLKITGDWQKFKGLPGTEGTLRVAAPKPEKRIAYEAAVKDAMNEPADGATTLKKKAAEKLAAKNAPAPEEVVAAVEEIVTEAVAEAVVEAAVEEAVAEVVAEAEAVVEATPEAAADAAPKEEAAE